MSTTFPPAPTYADPIEKNATTGKEVFSPLWVQWFLSVAQYFTTVSGGGGGVPGGAAGSLQYNSSGVFAGYSIGSGLSVAAGALNASGVPGGSDTQVQVNSAGAFSGSSALTFGSGKLIVTSSNAAALVIGANGATNPVLQVDASTASTATGVSVKGAAAGSGATLQLLSSGTNEHLYLAAKGTGRVITTGDFQALGNAYLTNGFVNFGNGTYLIAFGSGSWLNMSDADASAIGSGGAGVNPWIAYAAYGGAYFSNANAGDICYRNTVGALRFGNTAGNASMVLVGDKLAIGRTTPTSTLDLNGSQAHATVSKTAAYTLTSSDYTVRGDATTAAFSLTLPAASGCLGRVYCLKKTDASANAVTAQANGAETIDGANTKALAAQYATLMIQSNGTSWDILSKI